MWKGRGKITKIWISREQKELCRWNKKQKHFEKVLEAERNLKFGELDERLKETYFDKN